MNAHTDYSPLLLTKFPIVLKNLPFKIDVHLFFWSVHQESWQHERRRKDSSQYDFPQNLEDCPGAPPLCPSGRLTKWPVAGTGFGRENRWPAFPRPPQRGADGRRRGWAGSGSGSTLRGRRRRSRGTRRASDRRLPELAGERRGATNKRPRPLEPREPWRAPGESAAPQRVASRAWRPLLPTLFLLLSGLRNCGEKDEPLKLVPAAHPLPTARPLPPAGERSPCAQRPRLRQLRAQAPSKERSGRGGLPAPLGWFLSQSL